MAPLRGFLVFLIMMTMVNENYGKSENFFERIVRENNCELKNEIEINKYGRKVVTWFVSDEKGLAANKKIKLEGKKFSLHGIWPIDRKVYCNGTEVGNAKDFRTEELFFEKQILEEIASCNRFDLSSYEAYVSQSEKKNAFFCREFKKHYLLNFYTFEEYLIDFKKFYNSIRDYELFPHSCVYEKEKVKNIIQQFVSFIGYGVTKEQNFEKSCKKEACFSMREDLECIKLENYPVKIEMGHQISVKHEKEKEKKFLEGVINDKENGLPVVNKNCEKENVWLKTTKIIKSVQQKLERKRKEIKKKKEVEYYRFFYSLKDYAQKIVDIGFLSGIQKMAKMAIEYEIGQLYRNARFFIDFFFVAMYMMLTIVGGYFKKFKRSKYVRFGKTKEMLLYEIWYKYKVGYLLIVSMVLSVIVIYDQKMILELSFALLFVVYFLGKVLVDVIKKEKIMSITISVLFLAGMSLMVMNMHKMVSCGQMKKGIDFVVMNGHPIKDFFEPVDCKRDIYSNISNGEFVESIIYFNLTKKFEEIRYFNYFIDLMNPENTTRWMGRPTPSIEKSKLINNLEYLMNTIGSITEIHLVTVFLVCYYLASIVKITRIFFDTKKSENEPEDVEKIIDKQFWYKVKFALFVDMATMMVFAYIVSRVYIDYVKNESLANDLVEYSMENKFRGVTIVILVVTVLDMVLKLLPFSRRDVTYLEFMLLISALVLKVEEIKIMFDIFYNITVKWLTKGDNSMCLLMMILLLFVTLSMRHHASYINIWSLVLELWSIAGLVKLILNYDGIPVMRMTKEVFEYYSFGLKEESVILGTVLLFAVIVNFQIITNPSKYYKFTDTGKLVQEIGIVKHVKFMIIVFTKLIYFYVVLISGVFVVHSWIIPEKIVSNIIMEMFCWLVLVGYMFLHTFSAYAIKNFVDKRTQKYGKWNKGKIFFDLSFYFSLMAFLSLVVYLSYFRMEFGGAVHIIKNLGPYLMMNLFLEVATQLVGGMIGTTKTTLISMEILIGYNSKFIEKIVEMGSSITRLIMFAVKTALTWRMMSSMIGVFKILTGTNRITDIMIIFGQIPTIIWLLVFMIDSVTGLNQFFFKTLIPDEGLYRYEYYSRPEKVNPIYAMSNRANFRDVTKGNDIFEMLLRGAKPALVMERKGRKETTQAIPSENRLNGKAMHRGEEFDVNLAESYDIDPGMLGWCDSRGNYIKSIYEEPENEQANEPIEAVLQAPLNEIEEQDEEQDEINIIQEGNIEVAAEDVDDEILEANENRGLKNERKSGFRMIDTRPTLSCNAAYERTTNELTDKSYRRLTNYNREGDDDRNVNRLIERNMMADTNFEKNENKIEYGTEAEYQSDRDTVLLEREEFDKNIKYHMESLYFPFVNYFDKKIKIQNAHNGLQSMLLDESGEIIERSKAMKNLGEFLNEFEPMNQVRNLCVRTKVDNYADEIYSIEGLPMYMQGLTKTILQSTTKFMNPFLNFDLQMPKVVLANLKDEIKDIFKEKNLAEDEIVSFDDYTRYYDDSFESLYQKVENQEIYILTTKYGRMFVTTNEQVTSVMLNYLDQNVIGSNCVVKKKFGLIKTKIMERDEQVRPNRIEDKIMTSTGFCGISSSITLSKGKKTLFNEDFRMYIHSRMDVTNYNINNEKFFEHESLWQLITYSFSVGLVCEENNITPDGKSMNIGSCATVRNKDSTKLYVLTNKHVVKDYYGLDFNFKIGNTSRTRGITVKKGLVAYYTISGNMFIVKMDKLVAYGDDFALFEWDKESISDVKSFFARINQANPIRCFPTFGKIQNESNSYLSMTRQQGTMMGKQNNIIKQNILTMIWKDDEKKYEIWGYTVPGMSGSPVFDNSGNQIRLIALHSAVENNKMHMVHTTRLIDASKIEKEIENFEGKNVKTSREINCAFECATESIYRNYEEINKLSMCGSINTFDIECITEPKYLPHQKYNRSFIMCGKNNYKDFIQKYRFKSVYEKFEPHDSMILPSNMDPMVYFEAFKTCSRPTKIQGKMTLKLTKEYFQNHTYTDLVEKIDKIKCEKIKINGKNVNRLSWESKNDDIEFIADLNPEGNWDLMAKEKSEKEFDKMIEIDDIALIEVILSCSKYYRSNGEELVRDLIVIARYKTVYTIMSTGEELIMVKKERSDYNAKKCGMFEEDKECYLMESVLGGNYITLDENDFKKYSKAIKEKDEDVIEKIKERMIKIDELQEMRNDMEKKMEIAKKKISDFRNSYEYIEKKQKYDELMKEWNDNRKANKENETVFQMKQLELRNKMKKIEENYIKRIRNCEERKKQLMENKKEITEKNKEKIKMNEEKTREKIKKINEKIEQLKVEKKEISEKGRNMNETIRNVPKIQKINEEIEKLNSEIKRIHDEKEKCKINEKQEIKNLQKGENEKPPKEMNPEYEAEIVKEKEHLISIRNQNRNLKMQQEELKEEIRKIQDEIKNKEKQRQKSKKCGLVDEIDEKIFDELIDALFDENMTWTEKSLIAIKKFIKCYFEKMKRGEEQLDEIKKENEKVKENEKELIKVINEMSDEDSPYRQEVEKMKRQNQETSEFIEMVKKKTNKQKELRRRQYEEQEIEEEKEYSPNNDQEKRKKYNEARIEEKFQNWEKMNEDDIRFVEEMKKKTNKQKELRRKEYEKIEDEEEKNYSPNNEDKKKYERNYKNALEREQEEEAKKKTNRQKELRKKEFENERVNEEKEYSPNDDRRERKNQERPTGMRKQAKLNFEKFVPIIQKREIICYNCNKEGHMFWQCEERKERMIECYYCGKKGHAKWNCEERKEKENIERNKRKLEYEQKKQEWKNGGKILNVENEKFEKEVLEDVRKPKQNGTIGTTRFIRFINALQANLRGEGDMYLRARMWKNNESIVYETSYEGKEERLREFLIKVAAEEDLKPGFVNRVFTSLKEKSEKWKKNVKVMYINAYEKETDRKMGKGCFLFVKKSEKMSDQEKETHMRMAMGEVDGERFYKDFAMGHTHENIVQDFKGYKRVFNLLAKEQSKIAERSGKSTWHDGRSLDEITEVYEMSCCIWGSFLEEIAENGDDGADFFFNRKV